MRWKIIVVCAVVTCIASFTLFFKYTIVEPIVLGMPYILWVSMLSTTIMVVLTYLGFRYFPFNEKK